ncbi:MAG: type II toxin-antitoxin system VapC family toxin [Acinetobacter sp.]|nr:type II toxin-antitoxin system VapC family toxin [Acinetobacter sp.]
MYLIDTNMIIYHFAGNMVATDFFRANRGKLYISTMTVLEVLSFPASDQDIHHAERFLKDYFVWLDISQEIIFLSAKNRRSKKTKSPDAIIGATALHHNLTIVTHNIRDFAHLPIAVFDPLI